MTTHSPDTPLLKTPLYDLHKELGAKMVPFAGYEMPVQYEAGVMAEHKHCREKAGLFDVSHMGQAYLRPDAGEDAGVLFERLVPGSIARLKPGGMRYTLLLNEEGGILDDLMATRCMGDEESLFLVVNAGVKESDFAHIKEKLAAHAKLERLDDRALLALQGPKAEMVLSAFIPEVTKLSFMQALWIAFEGDLIIISRSGYTGEDGFEISLPAAKADSFARRLLESDDVAPIGLGARDSLRLEAGLCLYGHDISVETTPAEADLGFAIPKRRREAADFPGAEKILAQFEAGPPRKRVGIQPKDRTIAREGVHITTADGAQEIGQITSGSFGPTVNGPIAMGYVDSAHTATGTEVGLLIRGKVRPAVICDMPFVPHRYVRKSGK